MSGLSPGHNMPVRTGLQARVTYKGQHLPRWGLAHCHTHTLTKTPWWFRTTVTPRCLPLDMGTCSVTQNSGRKARALGGKLGAEVRGHRNTLIRAPRGTIGHSGQLLEAGAGAFRVKPGHPHSFIGQVPLNVHSGPKIKAPALGLGDGCPAKTDLCFHQGPCPGRVGMERSPLIGCELGRRSRPEAAVQHCGPMTSSLEDLSLWNLPFESWDHALCVTDSLLTQPSGHQYAWDLSWIVWVWQSLVNEATIHSHSIWCTLHLCQAPCVMATGRRALVGLNSTKV